MAEVAWWSALFAAVSVGAAAFELRRDVVPVWRLFIAPLAALACALALPSEPRWLEVAVGALAVGLLAGAVRGMRAKLRVDHIWKLVRLRRLYDGVAIALMLSLLAGADIAPVADLFAGRILAPFAAGVFLCAGYLAGRAGAIGLHSRTIPHDDMRPGAV